MGLISEHSAAAAATATKPAEQRLRRRKEPMVAENDGRMTELIESDEKDVRIR